MRKMWVNRDNTMADNRLKIFKRLGVDSAEAAIDWEITPSYTYGLFECRGDMQKKVRSSEERHYYFFVDNWVKPPQLCLMERGIRYAKVLARIAAPRKMIEDCVREQGWACKDKSYAINADIRQWLEENILDSDDDFRVVPATEETRPAVETGLPARSDYGEIAPAYRLRSEPAVIREDQTADIVGQHDFFESRLNPAGGFKARLADNGDGLTVTDMVTGLVWQRQGTDLAFFRKMAVEVAALNKVELAGLRGWRLPTIEEVLSLLNPDRNAAGLHVHPCFSPKQGFLYTADRHKPGGYWFVDLRQARIFWAGGTLSGGFGRFCCSHP